MEFIYFPRLQVIIQTNPADQTTVVSWQAQPFFELVATDVTGECLGSDFTGQIKRITML
jgi:hypothetical protein